MVFVAASQPSLWAWLGPFCGSVLLFTASMIVLWRTLKNTREEGRRGRAAQRNDRFREEVANLIGERWATEKAAYELATNAAEYHTDLHNEAVESERIAELLQVRDEYTPQLNKVEHLAIRASLLTNDGQISAVLDEIRTAAQGWKDLVDQDPIEKFIGIRDRLDNDFARLEDLTRRLVTSDGAT
jgi:hypothetical protein